MVDDHAATTTLEVSEMRRETGSTFLDTKRSKGVDRKGSESRRAIFIKLKAPSFHGFNSSKVYSEMSPMEGNGSS